MQVIVNVLCCLLSAGICCAGIHASLGLLQTVFFPTGAAKIDIMKIAPFSDKIFEQRINHLSTAKDE